MRHAFLNVLVALAAVPTVLAAQVRTDEWMKKPVDEKTFQTFRTFFVYDKKQPFETKVLDTATTDGVFVEHLTFQSTPGSKIYAKLYEPTTSREIGRAHV